MRIIMHTTAAGPDYQYQPGPNPIEVADDRARSFIAGGYATAADQVAAEQPPRRKYRRAENALAPAAPETR